MSFWRPSGGTRVFILCGPGVGSDVSVLRGELAERGETSEERHDTLDEHARFRVGESFGGGSERVVGPFGARGGHALLDVTERGLELGWQVAGHHLEQVVSVGIGETRLQGAGVDGKGAGGVEELTYDVG